MSDKKKSAQNEPKASIRLERVGSGLEYKLIEVSAQGEKILHESTKPIVLAIAKQWLWNSAEEA